MKGKFICMIGEGSTDSSIKEQEMWYLWTSLCGQVSVNFLGVKNVERANAENIVTGIKDLLNENLRLEYLDIIKKTVALLCNGASVIIIIMIGCRAGVGAMLREDQSCLITLHCMAHMVD
jgi:hypothetical protein